MIDSQKIAGKLQEAGVSGAGGAGFPTYVKWQQLDKISGLIVNLQEGEPVFGTDCWLVTSQVDFYQRGLKELLECSFQRVIIATKNKYREDRLSGFEQSIEPDLVIFPHQLPCEFSPGKELMIVYTGERYELSQETALIWTIAGQQIGTDLPTQHGWIVQNAETIYNILAALLDNRPVTRKLVTIYGPQLSPAYFDVPVGTPVLTLLKLLEIEQGVASRDLVLLDGGPGFACEIKMEYRNYGVSKRTNGVMVTTREFVENNRDKNQPVRINALQAGNWDESKRCVAPLRVEPETVTIPTLTNPQLIGKVEPSQPVVEPGQPVKTGEIIAVPASTGISNYQHASIDGVVREVTENSVRITV